MSVCEEEQYINTIFENVMSVRQDKFERFYNDIAEADCLIPVGEGRSQCALYIGLSQIHKEVKTIDDIDFPGRNIEEAAPILEKEYDRIALVVNSGSGETAIPKRTVEQLVRYIEETGSDKFTIDAIVSNPNSSIGRVDRKEFGTVIELKGRERVPNSAKEFLKHGIMNDIYELGSMLLMQKTKEAINEGLDAQAVFRKMEEEMKIVGRLIDEYVTSEQLECLIEKLERRGHVIIGGLGPARKVARMTVIRLQHVKRAVGDEAYLAGPLAPKPRAGDILIAISWSGETDPVLKWCEEFKAFGAYTYSIVGRPSKLSRMTESFIVRSSPVEFYERAAFLLSPLPLKLVERLDKRGFKLPEYVMNWYHSVTH
ncbi:MAG TPA: hypothetical protein ENF26_00230 [Methanomicrobia archaeon]|nr:D-arabinose 5-phosphate isomerase GutQ [Candidatus Alkanophaga volatiphilum]HDO62974.1 hypothetical protein [Methanomicrobia archaeon]HEX58567.1 hypothetical protein [Methanomicrobia archaeon]